MVRPLEPSALQATIMKPEAVIVPAQDLELVPERRDIVQSFL
jgi:hypothetical protein